MNGIINWMGGWPKEGLISMDDWEQQLQKATQEVASGEQEQEVTTQRNMLCDDEEFKDQIAKGWLKEKTGGDTNKIYFTSGANEAFAWLINHLLQEEDIVLTQPLCSRTALHAIRKKGGNPIAIKSDEQGMNIEELQIFLTHTKPAFIYLAPNGTDPQGSVWSSERKARVFEICRENELPIVCDDRAERITLDSDLEKNNEANETQPVEAGIISIGQLPPGLIGGPRLGWIIGEVQGLQEAIEQSISHLRPARVNRSIEQRALSRLINDQPLEALYEKLRMQVKERKDVLVKELKLVNLSDVSWTEPKVGMHLWLTLPDGLDGEALLRAAWKKGIIFQPGAPYFTHEPCLNKIRITYAFTAEPVIKEGVFRLSESIGEFTGRWVRD